MTQGSRYDLLVVGGGINGAGIARDAAGRGLSVLLCEQNLRFCEAIADRAYIIEKGQIRFGGTMAELAANSSLREQYLSV